MEKLVAKEVPVKEKMVVFSSEENLVKIIKEASLVVVSVTATTTNSLTATTTPTLSRSSDLNPDLEHRGSVGAEKNPCQPVPDFSFLKTGLF